MSLVQKFLKSRIVSLSYDVEKVMIQMAKSGFKDPQEYFNQKSSLKYHECVFYAVIARKIKINQFINQAEQEKYQESLENFKKFEYLKELINNLHDFYWQLEVLYIDITKTFATPNAWYRLEVLILFKNTTENIEKELEESIRQYIDLLNNFKDYPEWLKTNAVIIYI